jgi:hypothetical protein
VDLSYAEVFGKMTELMCLEVCHTSYTVMNKSYIDVLLLLIAVLRALNTDDYKLIAVNQAYSSPFLVYGSSIQNWLSDHVIITL